MRHDVISQRNGALNHAAVKISQGPQNTNLSTALRFSRETFFACSTLQSDCCVKCCCCFWELFEVSDVILSRATQGFLFYFDVLISLYLL